MSAEGLDALRSHVSGDPELALRLREIEPARFTSEVVRLARDLGCDLADGDLHAAAAEGQTLWRMRWIR